MRTLLPALPGSFHFLRSTPQPELPRYRLACRSVHFAIRCWTVFVLGGRAYLLIPAVVLYLVEIVPFQPLLPHAALRFPRLADGCWLPRRIRIYRTTTLLCLDRQA